MSTAIEPPRGAKQAEAETETETETESLEKVFVDDDSRSRTASIDSDSQMEIQCLRSEIDALKAVVARTTSTPPPSADALQQKVDVASEALQAIMSGHYEMMNMKGERFQVQVGAFNLLTPEAIH